MAASFAPGPPTSDADRDAQLATIALFLPQPDSSAWAEFARPTPVRTAQRSPSRTATPPTTQE
jgi:hypothetical protein